MQASEIMSMDVSLAKEVGDTGKSSIPKQDEVHSKDMGVGSSTQISEVGNVNVSSAQQISDNGRSSIPVQIAPVLNHELDSKVMRDGSSTQISVSSAQQISDTEKCSIPNQLASKPEYKVNFKGICDGEVKENHKNVENVEGESAEVRVVESRDNEDLSENPSCEPLGSSANDPLANCSLELPAESLIRNSSNPKENLTDQNHNFGFGSGNGVLEGRQVICDKSRDSKDSKENPSCELLGSSTPDPTIGSNMELPAESLIRNISSPKENLQEPRDEFTFGSGSSEVLKERQAISIDNVQHGSVEIQLPVCDKISPKHVGPSPEEANDSCLDELRSPVEDLTMKSTLEQSGLPPQSVAMDSDHRECGPPSDAVSKGLSYEERGPTCENEAKTSCQPGEGKKTQPKRKGKNMSKSLVGGTRVLRSRSQEKSKIPEPINSMADDVGSREKKKKKKKMMKKKMKKFPDNEFSKIKTHLRYSLTRMNYEQYLIDAYSGEGWKGQSLEKIKPEKELQRAKSEIFRRKLKIRDLFQQIDVSCAEGRIPESLFDSEGLIDSEDIFCAKCGLKDVQADNDIILCDGACERGFHQFCLEPPLLKEHVPPGDEGWLCPACDCKVDCIDLLNDSQGTNLSITDKWEKVFPEAAARNKMGDSLGLSSDDSEDDDYNPDVPQLDEEEGEDSSSDESDFSSASDDLAAFTNKEQHLEFPSDDSDDDDFDPDADARSLDEKVEHESSTSDFTSDSEDISSILQDEEALAEGQGPSISDQIKGNGERSRVNGAQKQSMSNELLAPLESDPLNDDSILVSGKRHVERLDYKKLHDETYGCNVSSDSSDEDFTDTAAPKRRKDNTGSIASKQHTRTPLVRGTNAEDMDMKPNQKQSECTPKKGTGRKLDVEGTSNSPAISHKGSSDLCSSDKSTTRPASYKRLGEAVTKRLFGSFYENQYPERVVKENLAKELNLTIQQVAKWFENARWCFRHSDKGNRVEKALRESGTSKTAENATCHVVENKELSEASRGNSVTKKGNTLSPRTPISRKRKFSSDQQETNPILQAEETPKQSVPVDLQKAEGIRRSGRIHSKTGGKSVS